MGLRQRCQKVYQATRQLGVKSVRALARATHLSKSSVHRLRQRIKRRHQEPESEFWETPEGFEWLRLLVLATIYTFGIKQGVGSEVISEFFHRLRYLFHSMRCLSRTIGARLGGKLARTKRKLQQTTKEITSRHLEEKPISASLSQRFSKLQEQYQFLELGVESYRKVAQQISTLVHPFTVDGREFQTGVDVANALRALLPTLAALGETYQLAKMARLGHKYGS